jgi:two-component sensor histidine kinase
MGPQRDIEREQTFPLNTAAPRAARRWLNRSFAPSAAIGDRAALLLSELVSNSVVHSGLPSDASVAVSVRPIGLLRDGIHVEVTDEGIGFNGPARGDHLHLGLRFVEATADRWGHSNDPTRVWFELTG